MMGAIISYFGSKMYLLLIGADLNAQFKIVYADGSKMTDKSESNISDLKSAGENDINTNIKVSRCIAVNSLTLTHVLTLPSLTQHQHQLIPSFLKFDRFRTKNGSNLRTKIEERPRFPMMSRYVVTWINQP